MTRTVALETGQQSTKTKRIHVSGSGRQHVGDYRFIDKDPVIDIARQAVQEDGRSWSKIEEQAGVSQGLLSRWFNQDTKRPQHLTVKFILDACDVKLVPMRADGTIMRGPRSH